jgi:hypothetical protein
VQKLFQQNRTGVWYLYDDGDDMKPEEFAIHLSSEKLADFLG